METNKPKEDQVPDTTMAASTTTSINTNTNVDKNEEWWKQVSAEALDYQNRANQLLEDLLSLRVEAANTLMSFASIHGTNFRYFQADDDEDEFDHPALTKK